jgi:hypothetical protein
MKDLELSLLIGRIPVSKRCEHLFLDEESPYCGKDLKGRKINMQERRVASNSSLKDFCLKSYGDCMFYKGTERFHE